MNSKQLYDLFREDVTDTQAPYLWSKAEAVYYMSDAYRMFFRLTDGIPDFTSEATFVQVSAGEPFSEVSSKILRFNGAFREDGRDLQILNFEDMGRNYRSDYGSIAPMSLSNTEGPVVSMIIGMERNKVRWVNVPESNQTVRLHINRLPLQDITDLGQEFAELDEIHHWHLLKWMKALAYRKQDADAMDNQQADMNEMLFRNYCNSVKAEEARYKHKARVVQYGGI